MSNGRAPRASESRPIREKLQDPAILPPGNTGPRLTHCQLSRLGEWSWHRGGGGGTLLHTPQRPGCALVENDPPDVSSAAGGGDHAPA